MSAEFTLARYNALQVVKQQYKARAKRLPEFGELRREANDYLDNHPELIVKATEQYRYLVESGYLKRPRIRKKASQ